VVTHQLQVATKSVSFLFIKKCRYRQKNLAFCWFFWFVICNIFTCYQECVVLGVIVTNIFVRNKQSTTTVSIITTVSVPSTFKNVVTYLLIDVNAGTNLTLFGALLKVCADSQPDNKKATVLQFKREIFLNFVKIYQKSIFLPRLWFFIKNEILWSSHMTYYDNSWTLQSTFDSGEACCVGVCNAVNGIRWEPFPHILSAST